MGKMLSNIFSPDVICICVNGESTAARYDLYHCYMSGSMQFSDISSLFLEVDRFFDDLKYPQSSTQARSFSTKGAKEQQRSNRKETAKLMSEQEVISQKGEKATFVIHVKYRQNATWQGSVVWAEKNVTKNFRSALELLKLIDSALDETGIKQE